MATFSNHSHAAHAGQQYPQNPLPDNSYELAPQEFNSNGEMLSPLDNLGILKNLTGEKKQTKDGQPPKRRGPKPDSKPALTRRQELNRQAQRTHRERKEMYIKALEQHAMSLREAFAKTEKERDDLAKENQMLKELLLKNGVSYDFLGNKITFQRDRPSPHHLPSSSGSISGSYQNATESTSLSPPPHPLNSGSFSDANSPQHMRNMAQLPNTNLDYDALGMDFVLTLEKPCTDHMQYLLVRSHNPEGQVFHHPMENADDSAHEHMSGHALMVSSVPYSHIMQRPAEPYPTAAPTDLVHHTGLKKLLEISGNLPFAHEGEIAPIQALSIIWSCARLAELTPADFERIKLNLSDKVRCYGFGAVLEEFEVRDALSAVLAEKDFTPGAINQAFVAQAIPAR